MSAFSLRALSARLAARLGPLARAEGGLLVLVLGEEFCRGLAVSGGRGRLTVTGFAEVPVDPAVRSLRARVGRVLDKLESGARRVVVVSPEVQTVPMELPAPRRRRGALAALAAAARREFPDYLDLDATTALLGVMPLAHGPAADAGFEDDEDPEHARLHVLAFGASRRHHAAVASAVKACGKKLLGLLPVEVFAFAPGQGPDAALAMQGPQDLQAEEDGGDLRVLLCATPFELHGVRLGDRGPEIFALESAGEGVDRVGAVQRLVAQLTEPGETARLIFGGEGGPVAGGVAFGGADDLEAIVCPAELPPRYMAALGAAVAVLRGGKFLLLHDDVSLYARLKARGYVVPVAFALALALGCGGVYGHMYFKIAALESDMATLEQRKAELQARNKRGEDLLARFGRLKKDIADTKTNTVMLESGLAMRTIRLAQLLRGLVVDTPSEIMISRFEKVSDTVCLLEGQGTSSTVVSQYLLLLRNTPFVQETRLMRSAVGPAQAARGRGAPPAPEAAPLHFAIRMTLGEDNG